jgi:hypothetical protein
MIDKPPRAHSQFLSDVLDSLRRRSKALKHQNATPTIERFTDTVEGVTEERVEIIFRQRKRQVLQMSVWEDRSVRVHASEAIWKGGWKFEYSCFGRFVAAGGARDLVRAAEASLSTMFGMTDENVALLDEIWGPLLAKGPTPI